MDKETIVCVSGYFNPVHSGHIRHIQEARKLGDKLVVIVNNDRQVQLKGSVPFMGEDERADIIAALKGVDHAVIAIDSDGSVCHTLEVIKPDIFAKSGDRTIGNVPETETCDRLGIKMVFGVGDGIDQSSSKILKAFWTKFLDKVKEVINAENGASIRCSA